MPNKPLNPMFWFICLQIHLFISKRTKQTRIKANIIRIKANNEDKSFNFYLQRMEKKATFVPRL